MEQLNRIEVRGNVGSVKVQLVGDKRVIHLTLATNYVYKGRNGEPIMETTWHNICAWEGKGMPDFDTIDKGAKVYACGRVRNQKYTGNDGIEKYSFEIMAYKLQILEDEESLQYEQ